MSALPLLCAALVGAALAVYALLAGFDLGVGLLTLIAPRDRDRGAMLKSLAPVWYGSAVGWRSPPSPWPRCPRPERSCWAPCGRGWR